MGRAGTQHAALLTQRLCAGSSCKQQFDLKSKLNGGRHTGTDAMQTSLCVSSGFAHKLAAERQWTQGLPPPPQRSAQPTTGVYAAGILHVTSGAGLRYSHRSDQQQLSSWEEVTCVKTEEQVLATEPSHKYLNTYPSRTLVM